MASASSVQTSQAETERPWVKNAEPRAQAERRAESMEQILDAAEYLFSKHGLYGVTLKDVARRVGVHHTWLNYYFEDKKKLFDKLSGGLCRSDDFVAVKDRMASFMAAGFLAICSRRAPAATDEGEGDPRRMKHD